MVKAPAITFRVKLIKIAIETFEMFKSSYGLKSLSRSSMLHGMKRSKASDSPNRTISGKAVLRIPEQKIR
jgi:hypothetical protein